MVSSRVACTSEDSPSSFLRAVTSVAPLPSLKLASDDIRHNAPAYNGSITVQASEVDTLGKRAPALASACDEVLILDPLRIAPTIAKPEQPCTCRLHLGHTELGIVFWSTIHVRRGKPRHAMLPLIPTRLSAIYA